MNMNTTPYQTECDFAPLVGDLVTQGDYRPLGLADSTPSVVTDSLSACHRLPLSGSLYPSADAPSADAPSADAPSADAYVTLLIAERDAWRAAAYASAACAGLVLALLSSLLFLL